ncbi:MAG: HupE/UreJ family protein [Sandaracinaceae bacterium]|nr:HupE/UreJ family protein [Sandaracinaceae bacterium]
MSAHGTRFALIVAMVFALGVASRAQAHESAPGVLGVEEQDDGSYLVAWTAPVDTRLPNASWMEPRFPEGCTREGARLDCGARGLEGEIAIDGLEGRMRVAVVVVPRDAAPLEDVLDASRPRMTVTHGGAPLLGWISLGAEHVLLGLDHLAFLLGLLFVSRLDRRLVLTITAFTLAHSVTLALAVLDLVHPSSALVEALIALSVLLVAREGLEPRSASDDASRTPWSVRRAPAAIAAFFGLVHGLGLAGALRETALPARALVPALFGFNVGVELGQLAFVGAALAIAWLVRERAWAPRARTALVYVVGSAAAYWLLVRTAVILERVVT